MANRIAAVWRFVCCKIRDWSIFLSKNNKNILLFKKKVVTLPSEFQIDFYNEKSSLCNDDCISNGGCIVRPQGGTDLGHRFVEFGHDGCGSRRFLSVCLWRLDEKPPAHGRVFALWFVRQIGRRQPRATKRVDNRTCRKTEQTGWLGGTKNRRPVQPCHGQRAPQRRRLSAD